MYHLCTAQEQPGNPCLHGPPGLRAQSDFQQRVLQWSALATSQPLENHRRQALLVKQSDIEKRHRMKKKIGETDSSVLISYDAENYCKKVSQTIFFKMYPKYPLRNFSCAYINFPLPVVTSTVKLPSKIYFMFGV